MKIIDLLNKIANDEEVPKKIKYRDWLYDWDESSKDYQCGNDWLEDRDSYDFKTFLNDEVEIIEPQEHKIPKKLEIEQDTPNSNFYIRNEYGTKCALTKHSKIIADKINEILDYLEVNNE